MTHLRVHFGTREQAGKPSVLRRLAHLALAVFLGSFTLIAVLLGGVARASVHASPPTADGPIPAGRPSSDGPIVVAVVLGRSGTDDADALAPYEVFARSTKFSVYSVAETSARHDERRTPPLPHLHLRRHRQRRGTPTRPRGRPRRQRPSGSAGGRATRMDRAAIPRRSAHPQYLRRLESPRRHRTARRAPGDLALVPHRPLEKSNPRVTWVTGQRYVDNGNITTSAAISSGIPASLHLMQELAGTAEAAKIAQQLDYPGWTIGGPTEIPIQHFSSADVGVGLGALLPWFQPTLAVASPTESQRSTSPLSPTSTATPQPRT